MQITDLPTELFTKFLLEMSLLDFRMLRFPPSTQALAALVVTVQAFQTFGSLYQMELGPKADRLQILIAVESVRSAN